MRMPFRGRNPFIAFATLAALAVPAAVARGQAANEGAKDVGEVAPAFSAPGATRYGLLEKPVELSDYRGQTVVLAFFYKARTKG